jgi:hypothetical protein
MRKVAGSRRFARTIGKRPRTKDDDDEEDYGNKLALMGLKPWASTVPARHRSLDISRK